MSTVAQKGICPARVINVVNSGSNQRGDNVKVGEETATSLGTQEKGCRLSGKEIDVEIESGD